MKYSRLRAKDSDAHNFPREHLPVTRGCALRYQVFTRAEQPLFLEKSGILWAGSFRTASIPDAGTTVHSAYFCARDSASVGKGTSYIMDNAAAKLKKKRMTKFEVGSQLHLVFGSFPGGPSTITLAETRKPKLRGLLMVFFCLKTCKHDMFTWSPSSGIPRNVTQSVMSSGGQGGRCGSQRVHDNPIRGSSCVVKFPKHTG